MLMPYSIQFNSIGACDDDDGDDDVLAWEWANGGMKSEFRFPLLKIKSLRRTGSIVCD